MRKNYYVTILLFCVILAFVEETIQKNCEGSISLSRTTETRTITKKHDSFCHEWYNLPHSYEREYVKDAYKLDSVNLSATFTSTTTLPPDYPPPS